MWLGKELHDWLQIVPLAAARLVSEKLEILWPYSTPVSLSFDIVFGMLSSKVRHTHRRIGLDQYCAQLLFHMGTPAILLCISVSTCGMELFSFCSHSYPTPRTSTCNYSEAKTEFRTD